MVLSHGRCVSNPSCSTQPLVLLSTACATFVAGFVCCSWMSEWRAPIDCSSNSQVMLSRRLTSGASHNIDSGRSAHELGAIAALDWVFPLHDLTEKLPTVSQLLSYSKIIVSGPQSSGTTYVADMLASQLNYTWLDETFNVTLVHKKTNSIFSCRGDCWPDFLCATQRVVAQRPTKSHLLHTIGQTVPTCGERILVMFVARNCIDVFRSQSAETFTRTLEGGWTCKHGVSEKSKYAMRKDLAEFHDQRDTICKIKQDVWMKHQRGRLAMQGIDALTLDYDSFASTWDSFVPEEDRTFKGAKDLAAAGRNASRIPRDFKGRRNLKSDCLFADRSPICTYRQICFNIDTSNWTVLYDPPEQTPTLHDLTDQPGPRQRCRNFIVSKATPVTNRSGLMVGGSTYLVCCWIGHFGHFLMNMVIPSFHALSRVGRRPQLSSTHFLIDFRGEGDMALLERGFGFFSGNPDNVLSLKTLAEESTRLGYTHVCFNEIVVGMLTDSLIATPDKKGFVRPLPPDASLGMLEPLRRHVFRTHRVFDGENPTKQKCNATIIIRRAGQGRNIVKRYLILDLVNEFFHKETWAVGVVDLQDLPLAEQYGVIGQTSLLISASGTGSHWATFLRDGAVSIVIKTRGYDVNENLCVVAPSVYCVSVESLPQNASEPNSNVLVEHADMKRALVAARLRLQPTQCR